MVRLAMPTNRTAIRRERRPSFTPEVLRLFAELEHSARRGPKFKEKARELARMLGLVDEWWTGNSVLNRRAGPSHPPQCIAHDDFYRCREVRRQLLAAIGQRGASAA
jgi:hypothetical protein